MLALLALTLPARAGFKLPGHVYPTGNLAAAQKEKKALTFVWTDAATSCPLCINTSLDVMQELKQRSVVVYVNARSDEIRRLPDPARKALHCSPAGKYLPRTVVMNAAATEVIPFIACTRDEKAWNQQLKHARKKIEAALGAR